MATVSCIKFYGGNYRGGSGTNTQKFIHLFLSQQLWSIISTA